MSGFFGIFNRNSKPVDKKIANDMLESMSEWDPDERDLWIDGPVALGHAMLWNTPESQYEHLPLQKDLYVLTMDARIDNRDELAQEIELPDRPMSEIGDSEFILAAYRKWEEECPKHLLGDFSFVIWDEEKQILFCSRDYIGIKQFYYYFDDEKFIFSNEMKVLLACKEIEAVLDENSVVKYLKPDFNVKPDFTFYENIHKLHFASAMTISRNQKKENIYWKIEECPEIRYENIEDYIHQARNLLKKAVVARTRSVYPIASHLSGGLDSSSIAVLAARELVKTNQTLTGFNWIPVLNDNSNYWEWNNSKNIALLENIKHQAIEVSENDIYNIYKTLNIIYGDTIHFWYEYPIQTYASKRNMRVLLSGLGGDEFISHKGLQGKKKVAKYSLIKKFKNFHRSLVLKNLKQRELIYAYIKKFCSFIGYRMIPDWLFCIYYANNCSYKLPKYIEPTVVKKIKKVRENRQTNNMKIHNSMLSNFSNGTIQARIESWDISGRVHKMEYRYPLLDRRMIEFTIGIPKEFFHHNDQERYLFKRIVEKLLPQEIIWSETKYEPERVKNYIEMAQKSQSLWGSTYKIEDEKCKFFKIDELLKKIDRYSSKTHPNYDIITIITSSILLIESIKKGKYEKSME